MTVAAFCVLLYNAYAYYRRTCNRSFWNRQLTKFGDRFGDTKFTKRQLVEHITSIRVKPTYEAPRKPTKGETKEQNDKVPVVDKRQHTKESNPHSSHADHRKQARAMIVAAFSKAGMRTYDYQSSDATAHLDGERSPYFASDLGFTDRKDSIEKDHGIMMVDVDYYVDMNETLHDWCRPIMIYTLDPTSVASENGVVHHHFAKLPGGMDDYGYPSPTQIVFNTGGTPYRHCLWDWSVSTLTVTKSRYCGLFKSTVVYAVEKRHLGCDHAMVALIPTYRCGTIGTLLVKATGIFGQPLKRFSPLCTEPDKEGVVVCAMRVTGPESYVSVGRLDGYTSANIPTAVFESAMKTVANSSTRATAATIQSLLSEEDKVLGRQQAIALHDYFLHATSMSRIPEISQCYARDRTFHPLTADMPEPLMYSFGNPLDPRAYGPAKSAETTKDGAFKRVIHLKNCNDKAELRRKPWMELCSTYFVTQMVAVMTSNGPLLPMHPDEVLDKQHGERQKSAMTRFYEWGLNVTRSAKMFIKPEAYAKIPDGARVITSFDIALKAGYSSFVLPMMAAHKYLPFYGFIDPETLGERLAAKCRHANFGFSTDYTRWDGRVTELLREMTELPLLQALYPEHFRQVTELHNEHATVEVRVVDPIQKTLIQKYRLDGQRGSGELNTSGGNTDGNAYLMFCAFYKFYVDVRRVRKEYALQHAWEAIEGCMFGGDDGMVMFPESFTKKDVDAFLILGIRCRTIWTCHQGRDYSPQRPLPILGEDMVPMEWVHILYG
jgi:hypothetical protein